MQAIAKWLCLLFGCMLPASLGAEEEQEWYFQIGGGGLTGSKQSSGNYPTAEFGFWKALSRGTWHTTG